MSLRKKFVIGGVALAGAWYSGRVNNTAYATSVGTPVGGAIKTCVDELSEARESSEKYYKMYVDEVVASDARYNKMLTEKNDQLVRSYGIAGLGIIAAGLICFQIGCSGRNSVEGLEPMDEVRDDFLLKPKN